MNRPRKEVSAYLCYIYYTFWKMMITNTNVLIPKNPECPVLFMYGKKKRIFFHNKEFIEHLNDLGYPNKHIRFVYHYYYYYYYYSIILSSSLSLSLNNQLALMLVIGFNDYFLKKYLKKS